MVVGRREECHKGNSVADSKWGQLQEFYAAVKWFMLPWSCTLRTAQGSYKPFRTNRRSRSLIYGAFETIFSGLVSLSSRSYFLGRWMARRYLIITHYWSITKHNSLTVLRSVWEGEKKRLFSLLALAWWPRQLACWGEWTHIFAARCVQSMKVEGNSISF